MPGACQFIFAAFQSRGCSIYDNDNYDDDDDVLVVVMMIMIVEGTSLKSQLSGKAILLCGPNMGKSRNSWTFLLLLLLFPLQVRG